MSYKTIFFGTPSFAIPTLEALITDARFDVMSVVSQPSKPVGRKQEIMPSAVTAFAQDKGLDIYLPDKIRTPAFEEWMKEKNPDICIVVAYGKIIPKNILIIPSHGFINIHGSLLPKYRGASPIQFALLQGETTTGVSIMVMDEKMDEGDVLQMFSSLIEPTDTTETLFQKLSQLGAMHIANTVENYIDKKIAPQPQNPTQATYCHLITKEMGHIDWKNQSAKELSARLRAFTPWPGLYTFLDGKRWKILEATFTQTSSYDIKGKEGMFFPEGIQTKQGQLMPIMVQPEGKKPMLFIDFLRGVHKEPIIFG